MLIESKSRVGHIQNFTKDFILQVLQDHGYTIIDKMYTPPTYTQTSAKQQFILVFRSMLFMLNRKFAAKTIGGFSLMVLTRNRA